MAGRQQPAGEFIPSVLKTLSLFLEAVFHTLNGKYIFNLRFLSILLNDTAICKNGTKLARMEMTPFTLVKILQTFTTRCRNPQNHFVMLLPSLLQNHFLVYQISVEIHRLVQRNHHLWTYSSMIDKPGT